MPTYVFKCSTCKRTVEEHLSIHAKKPLTHRELGSRCGGEVVQVFTPPAIDSGAFKHHGHH